MGRLHEIARDVDEAANYLDAVSGLLDDVGVPEWEMWRVDGMVERLVADARELREMGGDDEPRG